MIRIKGDYSGGAGEALIAGPQVADPNLYDVTFMFSFIAATRDQTYVPLIALDDLVTPTSESNMVLDLGYTVVPGEWRLFWYGNSHENNFLQTQTVGLDDYIVLDQDGEYQARIYNDGVDIACVLTFPNLTVQTLTLPIGVNTFLNCAWTLFGSRSIWWGASPGTQVNQDPEQIIGDFSGSLTLDTAYKDAGKSEQADIDDLIHTITSNQGDFIVDQTIGPFDQAYLNQNGIIVRIPSVGAGSARVNPRDSRELARIRRELRNKLNI